jgi:hypothetical protein
MKYFVGVLVYVCSFVVVSEMSKNVIFDEANLSMFLKLQIKYMYIVRDKKNRILQIMDYFFIPLILDLCVEGARP